MVDELDTGNSILEDNATASMKDLIDALHILTETNVELSNKITDVVDATSKPQVNIIANRPKTARKSMSALSEHFDKLLDSRSKTTKSDFGNLNTILGKLNTNIDALHSGIQSMIKKLENISSTQTTAVRETRKQDIERRESSGSKKRRLEEEAIQKMIRRQSEGSLQINKYIRLNPFLRNFFPKTTKMAKSLGNFGDLATMAGLKTTGGALRGWGLGIARMSPLAFGGALAIQAAISLAKRFMANGASAYQMEGITGRRYTAISQEKARVVAGKYGLSGDEFFKTQQRYAKSGIRDDVDVFAGIRAEKYFGVDNLDKYFQRLARSTNDTSKYAVDLGKSLFRLRVISEQTSMGISEVMQHQTGFMDAFKGQTKKFDGDEVVGVLNSFKKLIDSYETSGAELGAFYNTGQTVDTNTLLTQAHFAGVGGYRFNTEGNLLDRAYEVRRMGSGSLVDRANLLKASLQGIYSQFGVSKFSQLGGNQKFMVTEQLLPQLLGIDVSKLPSAEKFIEQFEKGGSITKLDAGTSKTIEDAKKTNLDTIVTLMAGLTNPVETIKNYLLAGAYGDAATRRLQIAEEDAKKEKESKSNHSSEQFHFTVIDATENGLKILSNTPGKKADVVQTVRRR